MAWLKNYKSSIILLSSVALGAFIGCNYPTMANFLKPFGEIFLNLMFVILVPLVFFSILSAMTKSDDLNRMKKITTSSFIVFFCMIVIVCVMGYLGALILNPLHGVDVSGIMNTLPVIEAKAMTFSEAIVRIFSAPDFSVIFSKSNLLPLIVFAFLLGSAINGVGEKGKPVVILIHSINEVLMKLINILMIFAPIGLGSYFAYTISVLGSTVLYGFATATLLYLILTVIYWAILSPLYAFIAKGPRGLSLYWKNIIPPSLMAIATSSSAACIPINLATAKKMEIQDDVAETVMPLGANIHKDGSALSALVKITFLFALTGQSLSGIENALAIIGVAILASTLTGAIPGGGVAGELMICTMFGFPQEMFALIVILATIVDIPATLLNSNGQLTAGMLVDRLVGRSKDAPSEI